MLTLKTHITPIDITGVAAATAQDQAEADATHVPYSPPDLCWCQPFDGPVHPYCPMHGKAEADALTLLDAGLDASGRWHDTESEAEIAAAELKHEAYLAWLRRPITGRMFAVIVAVGVALIVLAVKYGPVIWRML